MASSPALQLVKRFRSRELLKAHPGWETQRYPSVGLQNPFLPWFNPASKRWQPPLYSRRRQADLVKAAKATKTLHLLPPGPKLRLQELEEAKGAAGKSVEALRTAGKGQWPLGKLHNPARVTTLKHVDVEWCGEVKERQVAGADIGARLYAGKKRMFKGHRWERELEKRRRQTAIRLRDMPKRIKKFKTVYKRTRPQALGKIVTGKEKVGI